MSWADVVFWILIPQCAVLYIYASMLHHDEVKFSELDDGAKMVLVLLTVLWPLGLMYSLLVAIRSLK